MERLFMYCLFKERRATFSQAQWRYYSLRQSLRDSKNLPIDLLHGLFDLTPAEGNLAQQLVTGETLTSLADKLDLSQETLRSQLKSIFAKTGTHRQSMLVRLLAGISEYNDLKGLYL